MVGFSLRSGVNDVITCWLRIKMFGVGALSWRFVGQGSIDWGCGTDCCSPDFFGSLSCL